MKMLILLFVTAFLLSHCGKDLSPLSPVSSAQDTLPDTLYKKTIKTENTDTLSGPGMFKIDSGYSWKGYLQVTDSSHTYFVHIDSLECYGKMVWMDTFKIVFQIQIIKFGDCYTEEFIEIKMVLTKREE